MRLVIEEVERLRKLASLVDELNGVLLNEMAPFQLGEHVQPFEYVVGVRDQRLTDMEAREFLAFEELDLVALLSD